MPVKCCENCKREVGIEDVNRLQVNAFVGYVCPTCHHIFSKAHQQERFQKLIQGKSFEQSNPDMQSVHNMLSVFIGTGAVFAAIAFTLLMPNAAIVDVLFLNLFK